MKSRRTGFFLLMLSPFLFVLALPTFRSRPFPRNLGFMISDKMVLDRHISNGCCSASVKIRTSHQYMTVEASKTLVCAFLPSKLDHCSSLLSGCPLYLFTKLQKVKKSAVKLVFEARKRDHVQPLHQAFL